MDKINAMLKRIETEIADLHYELDHGSKAVVDRMYAAGKLDALEAVERELTDAVYSEIRPD